MNWERIYKQIIERGLQRGLNKRKLKGYFEKHHILPRCLGGSGERTNLVLLTAREHFLAHAALSRIYPDSYPLATAFHLFRSMKGKTNAYITSHEFQASKIRYAQLLAKERTGWTHSEETRAKMTETKNSEEGQRRAAAGQEGRTHSEATKSKIGDRHRGKVVSEETRRRLADSARNRPPFSEETRKKMSESRKKWSLNEESREKLSASLKGRKHSPETKAKMSATRKGRKQTEEHKAKVAGKLKGRKHSPETKAKIAKATRERHRLKKALAIHLPLISANGDEHLELGV